MTELRCPACGSTDCECQEKPHVHRCRACGFDGTAAVPEPHPFRFGCKGDGRCATCGSFDVSGPEHTFLDAVPESVNVTLWCGHVHEITERWAVEDFLQKVLPLLRTQVAATPAARAQLSNEHALMDNKVDRNMHALERIEAALGIAADERWRNRDH